jgi:2,3-bisphosphoglycerate-independent phosphoglycerate mutase
LKDDRLGKFSEKECRNGSLGVLDCGWMLMPKLMEMLKKQ